MEKLTVVALKPVTLYEDPDDFIFYASEEDVKKGKRFKVPATDFWHHKITKEKVLGLVSHVVKEKDEKPGGGDNGNSDADKDKPETTEPDAGTQEQDTSEAGDKKEKGAGGKGAGK